MVAESVAGAVKRYLHILQDQGIPVSFGIVFGSQATGKSTKWSDIDLLVVSPKFDKQKTRGDIDLLWRMTTKADNRIEPIPCGERQWEEDDSSAVIEIARREGERVTV